MRQRISTILQALIPYRVLFGIVGACILAFLIGWYQRPLPPDTIQVTSPVPGVTTIQVPVPVLTEKTVTKYVGVEDRNEMLALLAENDKLKIKVDQLSVSLAAARSMGQGTSTTTVIPATPTAPQETRVAFKDWRLDFLSVNNNVTYTLTQKFAVVNSVGRDKHNVPTNLIRLYEIGPKNERVAIPVTTTTTVAATGNAPHLYTRLTLQGGVGYTDRQQVFVLTPWLKYGRSTALEDTRWAFLTPAVALSSAQQSLGLAPVSFNIGSIPRQPLTNLWLSPYLGTTTGTGINQRGVVLSVTF